MTHWLDTLQVGDVVRFRSKKRVVLRTVLSVRYRAPGRLLCVSFVIMACSWTERPYTVLTRADLVQRALCKTKARVDITRYPAAMAAKADRGRVGAHRETFCCDVVGVFT